MSSSPITNRRLISGIMLALVVWGIYLAIGATGVFVQPSLMDPRKSVLVVVCVGLYLGLWSLVLWHNRRSKVLSPSMEAAHDPAATQPPWSVPGWASVGLSALGLGVWALAAFSWQTAPASTTTILGWLAAGLMMGAATAGMVSLSDRVPRRGNWLGYWGLLALLCSLVVFVVRMT